MKQTAEIKHVLGIVNSKAYNLLEQKEDYYYKITVTDAVYEWLDQHDVEYTEDRSKVFIVNQVKYIDLGIEIQKDGES